MEIPSWASLVKKMNKAIYPGSFDPLTLGHIDIINRSLNLFDHLLIAVTDNSRKTPTFKLEDRIKFIKEEYNNHKGVEVLPFKGLLVDFMNNNGIKTVVRGIRVFSDFEYEFQMALTNKQLFSDIETVFLLSEITHTNLSSSLIKDIIRFKGNIDPFIPNSVKKFLMKHQKEFL